MITSSSDSMSDGGVFQDSVYIGINIQNILYGVELLLYFKTIRALLTRGGASKKANVFYAFFSSMMVFLVTVWVASEAIFGEKMWLLNTEYPGGRDAYWKENISDWYIDWGTTAAIVLQLMTDALMIYRCRVIWNSYRAIIVPITLWFATLALGFLVDWTSSSPGGDFFTGVASQFGFAYCTVSVFLNTTLTCMICYRILRHGWAVQEYLGHEYASFYFSVAAVIVESVLPHTLTGVAFLVSLGMGSSTSAAFVSVYILMMCISPQMLILRVISGRAWDKDTLRTHGSTVKFNAGVMSMSQGFNTNRVSVHLRTLSRVYTPIARNRMTRVHVDPDDVYIEDMHILATHP